MIQITATMRILVAIEPVDLRKGIDGLAQFCRERLTTDPFSGCLFIFRSRRGTAIVSFRQSCVVRFRGRGRGLGLFLREIGHAKTRLSPGMSDLRVQG